MAAIRVAILAMMAVTGLGFSLKEDMLDAGDNTGDIWAVLVAGSDSWFNYRHQSDMCHAYQVLKDHGVPDERIIVMMPDDIAHNRRNKEKGKIFNQPGGPDVYHGVPKDYTGADVTPENFLAILSGKDMTGTGSGKTLKSGPNDRVFINLVDHGAPGIFGFPTSYLYAKDFEKTITGMHKNKLYKEIVIYLESCEAGSMFENILPDDIQVYAVTATNSVLSSFACYYDDKLGVYLGDVFSVKWMEDSDEKDLTKETLEEQFEIVKKATTSSPVQKFGQMSITKEVVGEFLGMKKTEENIISDSNDACTTSSVPSPDVPLITLLKQLESANSEDEEKELKDLYAFLHKNRQFARDVVRKIVLTVTNDADLTERLTEINHVTPVTNWECYMSVVDFFHERCFNLGRNPYTMRLIKSFSSLCDHGFSSDVTIQAMKSTCTHPDIINIH